MVNLTDQGPEVISQIGVDSLTPDTYYWRVDSYINGTDHINEPNRIEGSVWTYTTVAGPPPTASIDIVNTMTWSDNSVVLLATVIDDSTTLDYFWTAVPDGLDNDDLNVVFDPEAMAPTVTVTNTTGSMQTITMTLTADNEENAEIVTKSVEIDVYEDACDMAILAQNKTYKAADVNEDCAVNLEDFAAMAAIWLDDIAADDIAPR
jgi:hypothetical protein